MSTGTSGAEPLRRALVAELEDLVDVHQVRVTGPATSGSTNPNERDPSSTQPEGDLS